MWEKAIQTRIMSKLILSFCLFVYFFKPGVSNFTDLRTKFGIADVVSCSQILNLSADFKRTTALKKKKKSRVVTLWTEVQEKEFGLERNGKNLYYRDVTIDPWHQGLM